MCEGEEVVTEPAESEHAAKIPEIPEAIPEAIATVVVGKKKVKKAEVQKVPKPPEAPSVEEEIQIEKPKPKRASRARASTKPPPTPEPIAEPIAEPVKIKKETVQ